MDLPKLNLEDEVLRDAIAGELISSEIEIISGVGSDMHEALSRHEALDSRAVKAKRGADMSEHLANRPAAGFRAPVGLDRTHAGSNVQNSRRVEHDAIGERLKSRRQHG